MDLVVIHEAKEMLNTRAFRVSRFSIPCTILYVLAMPPSRDEREYPQEIINADKILKK